MDGALRVLLVDDDPETQQLVSDTLATEGHATLRAGNASEAMRMLERSHIDAIVLDLLLPGRSGFEFLAELRANEKWHAVLVMVLTAKDLDERERDLLAAQSATVFK